MRFQTKRWESGSRWQNKIERYIQMHFEGSIYDIYIWLKAFLFDLAYYSWFALLCLAGLFVTLSMFLIVCGYLCCTAHRSTVVVFSSALEINWEICFSRNPFVCSFRKRKKKCFNLFFKMYLIIKNVMLYFCVLCCLLLCNNLIVGFYGIFVLTNKRSEGISQGFMGCMLL